jgi:hypothetical protein
VRYTAADSGSGAAETEPLLIWTAGLIFEVRKKQGPGFNFVQNRDSDPWKHRNQFFDASYFGQQWMFMLIAEIFYVLHFSFGIVFPIGGKTNKLPF